MINDEFSKINFVFAFFFLLRRWDEGDERIRRGQ
jgi:hypothetical protein